jgi:Flp pilus assembly protein TadG
MDAREERDAPLARAPRGRGFNFLARLVRSENGSNAVEFAIVVPLLLALFLGIFEFGRAVWVQGMLDYAVEQAARCASLSNSASCGTAAQIASYAAAQTSPLNIPAGSFAATTPACGNQVTATYIFSFIGTATLIGGSPLFPTSVTLTSSSCYPI